VHPAAAGAKGVMLHESLRRFFDENEEEDTGDGMEDDD
jgi:hypothetical protein